MIVQCDQCTTKFKLDDSKVTPSGIKVRCAKCKHVFLVKKEAPEDVDLDQLLGKLDGSSADDGAADIDSLLGGAPQVSAPASSPAPAQKKSASEIRGVSLGVNTAPAAAVEDEGFSLDDLLNAAPQAQPQQGADPASFGDFDFNASSSADDGTGSFGDADSTASFSYGADTGFGDQGAAGEPFGSFDRPPEGFSEESLHSSINEAFGTKSGDSMDAGDIGSLDLGGNWGSSFSPVEEEKPGGESDELADLLGFSSPAAGAAQESSPEFSLDSLEAAPSFAPSEEPAETDEVNFQFETAPVPAKEEAAPIPAPPVSAAPSADSGSSSLAIVFPDAAEKPAPSAASRISFDEELPPLVISSRKKEGASFPLIAGIAAAIIVVLLGGSFFLYSQKPALLQQMGLGGAVDWLDIKTGRGSIGIRNIQGKFLAHPEGGEVFVIRGEAVNNYRRPIDVVRVRGNLYRTGKVVLPKIVACGGSLSDEQLTALPTAQIDAELAKARRAVQAGEAVPFAIVFAGVPADVDNFGVELVLNP